MSGILLEKGGGVISASMVPHVRNTSGKWGWGGGGVISASVLPPVRNTSGKWGGGGGGVISASMVPHVRNTSGKGRGGNFCVRGTPCLEYFWKMGGG